MKPTVFAILLGHPPDSTSLLISKPAPFPQLSAFLWLMPWPWNNGPDILSFQEEDLLPVQSFLQSFLHAKPWLHHPTCTPCSTFFSLEVEGDPAHSSHQVDQPVPTELVHQGGPVSEIEHSFQTRLPLSKINKCSTEQMIRNDFLHLGQVFRERSSSFGHPVSPQDLVHCLSNNDLFGLRTFCPGIVLAFTL